MREFDRAEHVLENENELELEYASDLGVSPSEMVSSVVESLSEEVFRVPLQFLVLVLARAIEARFACWQTREDSLLFGVSGLGFYGVVYCIR